MNFLFTSSGRRTYLIKFFRDALKEADIQGEIYTGNYFFAPTFIYADKHVITPPIYDDTYIDFLLEYCLKNSIDVLIPLFDSDVLALAKNIEIFKDAGISVLVSNYEFVKNCNDKYFTYKFLKDSGIITPKTFVSMEEAENAIDDGEVTFPLIIKPRYGMGSIGLFRADNKDELKMYYYACKKKAHNTYIKHFEIEKDESIVIQEYIDGVEYGLDIINDLHGDYVNTVCKRKDAMRSGETDVSETVDISELKKLGESISNIGKHIANCDCDVLYKDGKYFCLELNPRFGGGYPFSHAAGINLPLAIILWLSGKDGSKYCKNEKIGVKAFKEIDVITI